MKFTKIPVDTFKELQVNAGVLLKRFNPAVGQLDMDALITATSGGIKIDIKNTFEDFGSDVDNAKKNSKQLKRKTEADIGFSCTALNLNKDTIKMALAAAEERTADGAIILRTDLALTDFQSIWFVGDMADGGYIAIKFIDALSTDGFSLQTNDKGKGKLALGFKAHTSLDSQDTEPVEIYLGAPDDESASIRLDKKSLSLTVGGDTETISAITVPAAATVTWASTNTSVATVSGGIVTAQAAGTCVITASITEDEVTYMDTCIITVSAAEEGEG